MSRKLTALAALNILGWVVAVPLLLFAVVDPFVEFPGLPGRVGPSSAGTVHLDEPALGPSRPGRGTPRRDDPLRAAREALARFAPGSAGTVALVPGSGAGGGVSPRDRLVADLRSRAGRTRPLGTPPASRGLASPPAPAVAPPASGTPGRVPAVAPAPAPVTEDAARPVRTSEPPAPETAQAHDSPPGKPEGQDSAPPPAEAPEPGAEPPVPPAPPAGEPPAPETPPPPASEPPAPETPAPPAGEPAPPPDAPETPAPPEDPPEDPGDKNPIPPAVKPPHEDVPQPYAPAEPGPGNC